MLLSSHMMGMWQYTSMGCVSPASTMILQSKARLRGRTRCAVPGWRSQGNAYPFSPLLMNFWTSFTPRRICLCLAAAREAHREGLRRRRPVPPGPT